MYVSAMVTSIATMACMLMIGASLRSKITFDQSARNLLSTLIVNVAVPSLIVVSFQQLPHDENLYGRLLTIFLISLGLYLTSLVLVWWISRLSGMETKQSGQTAVLASHANTGFIGIPLCYTLFGNEGVVLATAFDMATGICLWTVSVMVLKHEYSLRLRTLKPLLNMPLFAIVVGLIFFISHVNLPTAVLTLLNKLGALTTPLALIYIGLFLPQLFQHWKKVSLRPLALAVTWKLITLPLLTIGLLSFLSLDTASEHVVLLLSTMSTGSMIPILFAQLKSNEELGAHATVLTTMLSLITIPVLFSFGIWIL
jgi:predicted permease